MFLSNEVLKQAMSLFEKGGVLMWPLLALSFVALMVIVINLWTTREGAILPLRLVSLVETRIRRKDYAGLADLCEENDSSFTRTLQVIITFLQRNRTHPADKLAGGHRRHCSDDRLIGDGTGDDANIHRDGCR